MKIGLVPVGGFAVWVVLITLLSCSRPQPSIAPLSSQARAEELSAFAKATVIKIGEGVELLHYEKDRELLAGLEIWVLFSPSEITPKAVAPDVDWLELRILESRVDVIEHRLSPRKIGRPLSGFHAEWLRDGRLIQADILRTEKGTYLEVTGAPN